MNKHVCMHMSVCVRAFVRACVHVCVCTVCPFPLAFCFNSNAQYKTALLNCSNNSIWSLNIKSIY